MTSASRCTSGASRFERVEEPRRRRGEAVDERLPEAERVVLEQRVLLALDHEAVALQQRAQARRREVRAVAGEVEVVPALARRSTPAQRRGSARRRAAARRARAANATWAIAADGSSRCSSTCQSTTASYVPEASSIRAALQRDAVDRGRGRDAALARLDPRRRPARSARRGHEPPAARRRCRAASRAAGRAARVARRSKRARIGAPARARRGAPGLVRLGPRRAEQP